MRSVSFGPARAVAAIAIALGIGSLAYRLLHAADLSQTAALFIGIPSLMAFTAAVVALRMRTDGIISITLKTITIGLLLAGPLLGEGFICVLLAAPLFYAVGLLIAVAIRAARSVGKSRRPGTLAVLALPMLVFSLEGAVPALTFPRQQTSVAERTVVATPESVAAALAEAPHFDAPLPGVLGIGFPKPATASGGGLAAGDRRVVTFVTGSGRKRDLVLEVAASGPGWVGFSLSPTAPRLPNGSPGSRPTCPGRTWATVARGCAGRSPTAARLDPAWYFGPWESVATTLAAEYLIQSAATPAAS